MNLFSVWKSIAGFGFSDALAIWSINVLLQATIVAALALALAAGFRRSPAMRYGILCCGLLLIMLSPASVFCLQTAGVGLLTVSLNADDESGTSDKASAQRAESPDPAVSETNIVVDSALPSSAPSPVALSSDLQNPEWLVLAAGDKSSVNQALSAFEQPAIQAVAAIEASELSPEPLRTSTSWSVWLSRGVRLIAPPLLILWLSIAALLLARLMIGWGKMMDLLFQACQHDDAELAQAFQRACAALSVPANTAQLRLSTRLSGPIAAGLFRPKIVLPANLKTQISRQQLHEILVHELAHIVRHDQIVVLVQHTASALFWLHPLARWLNCQLAQAREEVCDNYVLSASDAPTYSRTLLTIAELATSQRPLPGSVGLFTSQWKLESRVAGLLDARRNCRTKLTIHGIFLVTLTGIALVAVTSLATISLAVVEAKEAAAASNSTVENDSTPTTIGNNPPGLASSRVTVTGTVVGPDGNPIANAIVLAGISGSEAENRGLKAAPPVETRSDHDGNFSVSYVVNELLEGAEHISQQAWKHIRAEVCVVAVADGLAADWRKVSDIKPSESIRLQLAHSQLLHGRLLTIEGNPVPGAHLRLKSLASAKDQNIEPWLTSLREGEEIGIATDKHALRSLLPELLDRQLDFITDTNGRFEIPDVGQDQIATLVITGKGIARQVVRVIARELEPMSTNSVGQYWESPTLYGANAGGIVSVPSQPIVGVIRDAETGMPLRGVDVEAVSVAGSHLGGSRTDLIRVVTDEEGRFQLEGLPKGKGNTLLAVPNDDQPYFMREVSVPDEDGMQAINLNIDLTRGRWLVGRVVERDSGEPVSAELRYFPFLDNSFANEAPGFNTIGGSFMDACFSYQARYVTRPDGSFRIVVLPGQAIVGARTYGGPSGSYQSGIGSHDIPGMKEDGSFATYRNPFVASNKYPNVMVELDVPETGDVPEVLLEAVPGVPVRMRVLNGNGEPMAGFRVSGKTHSSQWDLKQVESEFEVTGLGPQDSRTILVVHDELGIGKAFRITPDCDRTQTVELRLEPFITVRGRIVDQNEAPVAHARMRAYTQPSEDYNPNLVRVTTDADGRFEISNVPAGVAYRIDGYTTEKSMAHLQTIEFEGQAGQTIELGTYRADPEGKLIKQGIQPTPAIPARPTASGLKKIKQEVPTQNLAGVEISPDMISGVVKANGGQPAAGAMVAVVAMQAAGDAWPRAVTLAEVIADAGGRFSLPLGEASTANQKRLFVVARTEDSALAWQGVDLDAKERDVELTLADPQSIQVRLVDSEGVPQRNLLVELMGMSPTGGTGDIADGIGFGGMVAPTAAAIPSFRTDDSGLLNVTAVPPGTGVLLQVKGNEHIAPQSISLNSGQPEERGERDRTYRSLVKNLQPGEVATLSLAPAQFFAGRVLLGDSDQPAANARITIGASQQSSGGSSVWLEGKTDREGRFRICPHPGINFQMIAFAPDKLPYHNRQIRDLKWESGPASENLEIRLTKGVLVAGSVRDAQTQAPLVGATIQYVPHGQNEFVTEDIVTGWQSIQQSDAAGWFAITTPPGKGTLLVHAPEGSNYVLDMRGSRELSLGKPGGARTYAHAFVSVDLAVDEPQEPLTIDLPSGGEVMVKVVDPQKAVVDGFSMLSLLKIWPQSPQWRGFGEEVLGSEARLRGLPNGQQIPVIFLHPERQLGAVAMINADDSQMTVELQPCGSAIARFVDQDGRPLADRSGYGLQIVVTPGPTMDANPDRNAELWADEDFVVNFDRLNHWELKTNEQGEIRFPALVPGATYRFINRKDGQAHVTDFIVAPAEKKDLGEFVINSPE